jgi:anhydro-N-acetylmuramic acid kinase
MSGSSLDGLDIAYVHLQEGVSGTGTADKKSRKWEYNIQQAACYSYSDEWKARLAGATSLSAQEYLLLHVEFGRYIGEAVLRFNGEHGLDYQVQLIVSHGHTAFHLPGQRMTAQLGDGATIAAVTSINVVSDLRSLDVALGGQGAPIVPIGEKLLFQGYEMFLNLGGIANISAGAGSVFTAYDICPANRVLNELAGLAGKVFDEGGSMAASGQVHEGLLKRLNDLPYYGQAYPKSLANEFGTKEILPIIRSGIDRGEFSLEDALRTYIEHIAIQVVFSATGLKKAEGPVKMLVTGGGAHNSFLIGRLKVLLSVHAIDPEVPESELVDNKEAVIMALIGVLRWREENNVLASVTGAVRDSIGGAFWIGQDA